MPIDPETIVGTLTHEETKALLRECASNLTLSDVIQCLDIVYEEQDDRDEIAAHFED